MARSLATRYLGRSLAVRLLTLLVEVMIIRELELADYNRGFCDVLSVLSPCVLTYPEFHHLWYKLLHFRAGFRQTYVAVDEGKVVGTATLLIDQKFARRAGKAANIEDVAVLPAMQGKGVGKQLIQHLVEEARKVHCYKVILSCAEGNTGFYEKNGFRRHEVTMRIDL